MTRLLAIDLPTGLTLVLLLTGSGAFANSLYRCVTETEGTIYTDNPAQLEQCVPMTASGAVTSLATVSSGGPPIGAPTDPLPMTQTPPELSMPPPDYSNEGIVGISQNAAPDPLPCPTGVNPLNPLSAPPCPTNEAAPPPINMPPAPGAAPAQP